MITFSKHYHTKRVSVGCELSDELWYVTGLKGRHIMFFAITRVEMEKYPKTRIYNLTVGPLVFRLGIHGE